ncbi:MAG: 4'-phosphopantetheinyl transferase family protein [Acidobacteriaceae bacterium]
MDGRRKNLARANTQTGHGALLWPVANEIPPLGQDHVDVWAWKLDVPPIPLDWESLSAEETDRGRRFVRPGDRDRFVRAHAAMRQLLSHYAHIDAAAIAYKKTAYGKPEIVEAKERVHFNLSHTSDIAVLAVSLQYELGADIERTRPISPDVAERYFSLLERETLRALPADIWLPGFYRCWTGKEALLKGEGLGLNLPLDAFDVEADPRRSPALLASRHPALKPDDWQLLPLEPAPNIMGTLAIRTAEAAEVRPFSLPV